MPKLVKKLLLFTLIIWCCCSLAPTALAREYPVAENSPKISSIEPYLDRVQKKIVEFRLENGMKFIVLERDRAPVMSMMIYANVGGANEPDGQTGVAHYLEHLAFKGTTRIGTKDYAAEKPILAKQDEIYEQIKATEASGKKAELDALKKELEIQENLASQYVETNEFGKIIEQAGGVGLNAATSTDATMYFYSLPSNKLELWMSLESERFLDPVFRDFYKEKQVILEERRLRTDNSPINQLLEAFIGKAFARHPYKRPVIGYSEDIRNLTRQNVKDFFDIYYVPNNLTAVVVGNVDAKEVQRLAQIYFGRFPNKPQPPELAIVEPPQTKTKEVVLKLVSQPWYLEGYHKPAMSHPDNAIYNLMSAILSDGRTSRLYKSLVETQKIALVAQGFSGYPGSKYPNLMMFYALTAPGHTVDELAQSLAVEINKLKTTLVTDEELNRVKNQAKVGLLSELNSNSGMAFSLAEYEVKTGSWQNLFKELEAIEAVTPADIQRVANSLLRDENKTIGKLLTANN